MYTKERAVTSVTEKIKDFRRINWRRNIAAGALAFSVLAGACGSEHPEGRYKQDSASAADIKEMPERTEAEDLAFGAGMDARLEYNPEDYPPGSDAFRMPASYTECVALVSAINEDVSNYENFLQYLAGQLQLTQEAWDYVTSGMRFYCDIAELSSFCDAEDEVLAESDIYTAGCYNLWFDDEYYYSQMHVPLNEETYSILSHELLHAAEKHMEVQEWQRVTMLLEMVLEQVEQEEMEALLVAGALVPFSTFEIDEQNDEVLIDVRLDFTNEAHVQEFYAMAGTIFSRLPEELEKHYARYFIDRQAIVRLHWAALDMEYFMQSEDS